MAVRPGASERRLGRPRGGGNEPDRAKEVLLDAAERSFIKHGYKGTTMAIIAAEAGYTRTMAYRHFATRDALIDALVRRIVLRQVAKVAEIAGDVRQGKLAAMIVEGLVAVATDLQSDPLYAVVSERTSGGNVAQLFVNAQRLVDLLVLILQQSVAEEGPIFRSELELEDIARFLLSTGLSAVLGVLPGGDDRAAARRHVELFVLPAIMADQPPA